MTIELGIMPSGHLRCYQVITDNPLSSAAPVPTAIEKAFAQGMGEGLFALSAPKNTISSMAGMHKEGMGG